MNKRRLLSLLLALAMLFALIPSGIVADEGDETAPVETTEPAPAAEPDPAPATEPDPAPAAEPDPAPATEPDPAPAAEPDPAPEADEPEADEPAADEPAANEPEADEPAADEPEADEPEADEPEADEPAADEPEADEPEADEPEADEPEADEPEADEPEADEPAADETENEEPAEEAFEAGLATLSAGELFADKWLRETAGTLNGGAVVYAAARASGEGELSGKDAIRVVANVGGSAETFYVPYARLTMLTEAQAAAYSEADHEDGILYGGAALDPVDFTAAVTEEPAAEETEAEPEAEEPAEKEDETESETEEPVAEDEDDETVSEDEGQAGEDDGTVTEGDWTAAVETEEPAVEAEPATEEEQVLPENTETVAEYEEPVAEIEETDDFIGVETADMPENMITVQPKDVYDMEVGKKYVLTVTAIGEGLTYQWMISTDNGETWKATGAAGNKTAKLTIVAKASYDLYQYRCDITNQSGVTFSTRAATVHFGNPPIVISKQPSNVPYGSVGKLYPFTVEATGETELSYRWKISTDGGITWNNTAASGYSTKKLQVRAKDSYDGYQYYCEITDANGNKVCSSVATLYLADEPEPEANIIAQPQDVVDAVIGQTYAIHVNAEGENLKYRWKVSTNGGARWSNTSAPGYNTDTLSITVAAKNDGYQYYCIITDQNGMTVNSSVATIHIAEEPANVLTIQTQPVDIPDAVIGQTYDISVVATGEDLSYRWKVSTNGGARWSNTSAPGYNTDTLTITVAAKYDGYKYYCHIVDGDGNTLDTIVITVTLAVAPDAVITEQPVNAAGLPGDTVSFAVTATDATGYQWQQNSGSGWADIAGATNAAYELAVTEDNQDYSFRCVVSGENNEAVSDAVVIDLPASFVLDDVTYTILADHTSVSVSGYANTGMSSLVIPTTARGFTVIEVGEEAFYNNTTLTSISLPNSIEYIRARAFAGCTNLSSMTNHD